MTGTKMARLLQQQDRAEINIPIKGTDNTIMTETTDISKEAIATWCAQIRAIRAEIGSIEDDDPRMEYLRDDWRYGTMVDDFHPDQRGRTYFELTAKIPPYPVEAPAWATTTILKQDDYPYMLIEWASEDPDITQKEWRPFIRQHVGICVEDVDDRKAGDVFYATNPLLDVGDLADMQEINEARDIIDGIRWALEKAGF